MSDQDRTPDNDDNAGVVVQTRTRTKRPSMYKVLMLNDDYTPMEFVVHVLERFFSKTREEATQIMLHVHRRGVGFGRCLRSRLPAHSAPVWRRLPVGQGQPTSLPADREGST